MFKKIFGSMDVKVLSAAVIPIAGMVVTSIISPLFRYFAQNSLGAGSQLTVPVSPQGTGYFVSHPSQPSQEKLCL